MVAVPSPRCEGSAPGEVIPAISAGPVTAPVGSQSTARAVVEGVMPCLLHRVLQHPDAGLVRPAGYPARPIPGATPAGREPELADQPLHRLAGAAGQSVPCARRAWAPPVLIVNATHDANTSYKWAHVVAGQIRGSGVFTRVGDGRGGQPHPLRRCWESREIVANLVAVGWRQGSAAGIAYPPGPARRSPRWPAGTPRPASRWPGAGRCACAAVPPG
jgi:hypothetical protein